MLMKALRNFTTIRRLHVHSMENAQRTKEQRFDYFLVLDFEATCDNTKILRPQEIIEFPVLKFNSRTLQVETEFHQYVQPRVHKKLTPFCTELTGILQEMVDNQSHLEETLQKFDSWMENEVFSKQATFTFVTCGDWDLGKMLPTQCSHFGIPIKPYFSSWINIKKAFAEVTRHFPKGMMPMLQMLEIPHTGHHHSGIDDCRNIAAILRKLLKRGYVFSNTGSLARSKTDVYTMRTV